MESFLVLGKGDLQSFLLCVDGSSGDVYGGSKIFKIIYTNVGLRL